MFVYISMRMCVFMHVCGGVDNIIVLCLSEDELLRYFASLDSDRLEFIRCIKCVFCWSYTGSLLISFRFVLLSAFPGTG